MRKADFVIITALPEERDAVLSKLGPVKRLPPDPRDPNVYYAADVSVPSALSGQLGYNVILTSLTSMGRVQAALATNDAIRRWQPEYVMLVGIAGGFRGVRPELELGDVLIADEIIDYELQKILPDGPEIRDKRPPLSIRLLTAAQNFTGDWTSAVSESRPAPGRPKCLFGPIATGDKVINDLSAIRKLLEKFPKLTGVEMEAGGAGSAALRGESNFFMVRGVSDFADGTKNSGTVTSWRKYSCDVAAAYALSLLRSGMLPPPAARQRASSNAAVAKAVSSTARAVAVMDKISDDVTSLFADQPLQSPREHRSVIQGSGLELVVREGGQVVQTITAADLDRLPPDMLRYITVLEKSMEAQFAVWEEVRPQLATMVDPVAKAKVRQQLRSIAEEMKGDLVSVLDFLKSAGFYLDDHYLHFRQVIAKPD